MQSERVTRLSGAAQRESDAPDGALKILHVIASADPRFGGPIEGILQQERAFAGRAVSELVTLDAKGSAFLEHFPLTVHALGRGVVLRRERSLLVRYGFSFEYLIWLYRHAREYDVVVVHGLWNFATMAAAIVLPLSIPGKYYVYPHGMLDPWFAQNNPKKHFVKRLSWIAFEGRLLGHARGVLFTAEAEKQLARNQFWGWRYKEVVVGYGTAKPPVATAEQLGAFEQIAPRAKGRSYLLFLSRIHPKKGCDLLIASFAKLASERPDLDLVIAGPDECGLLADLKAQAESLGIADKVYWPGMLTGDAKWGAYRGAEAFILPSHQENFGIVVAEALACGIPVLTTNKVNISEFVEAVGAGFIGEDTVEGVSDVLRRWFGLSAAGRKKMSEAAEILFQENFSVEFVAKNFLELVGAAASIDAQDKYSELTASDNSDKERAA